MATEKKVKSVKGVKFLHLWDKKCDSLVEKDAEVFESLDKYIENISVGETPTAYGKVLTYWRWFPSASKIKREHIEDDYFMWIVDENNTDEVKDTEKSCGVYYQDKEYLVIRVQSNSNDWDKVVKIFVKDKDEPKARELLKLMIDRTSYRIGLPDLVG